MLGAGGCAFAAAPAAEGFAVASGVPLDSGASAVVGAGESAVSAAGGALDVPVAPGAQKSGKLAEYLESNEILGWKFSKVVLTVDTCKAVLFPAGENVDAKTLLEKCGIPVAGDERVVVSGDVGGIGAVMAVDKGVYDMLAVRFDNMGVFHPLLGLTGPAAKKTLRIYTTRGNIYLALFADGVLKRTEAVPYNRMDDVSYFVNLVLTDAGRRTRVQLFGRENTPFGRKIEKKFSAKQKSGIVPDWLW